MKIAFVCPDDLSTLIFCKTFCKVLNNRGITDVYTISPIDQYGHEIKMIKSEHKEIEMDRYISPLSDIRYFFKLYKFIKSEKFDIVITFTTKPNVFGAIAAKLAKVPCVVMAIRGLGRAFGKPVNIRGNILLFLMKQFYRIASRHGDHIWFTNTHDRDFFVSHKIAPKNKTFLTLNAVDIDDFSIKNIPTGAIQNLRKEFGFTDKCAVVIMVARLIWAKGIKEYLEAAEMLKESCPNLRFLLVAPSEKDGPGSVPESYVREMEAKSNLIWLGFRKDVRTLYAMSDLAVLPSYYQEGGYPRALLEPMAFGKPVIAGDTDVCRGPVEHGKNGLLVPVKNSKALADAVSYIIMDDDKRKKFGEYSIMKVRREFDDKKIIDLVLSKII